MNHPILKTLLFVALFGPALAGQGAEKGTPRVDVTARFEPARAAPGDQVTLILEGKVHEGYHLYGAADQAEPPSLNWPKEPQWFEPVGKFQVPDGDPHINLDFPDEPSFWISGPAVFRHEFRIKADAQPGKVEFKGSFRYVACTEKFCDPEYDEAIAVPFEIVAGQAKAKRAPQRTEAPASTHTGERVTMEVVVTPATARPGEVVTVEIRSVVVPGWHLYGADQDPDVGTPTTLAFEDREGNILQPVGPAEVPGGDFHEADGIITHELVDEWKMSQKLRVPADAKPGEQILAFHVHYMACDERFCDAPVKTVLGGTLKIEAGAPRAEYAAAGAVTGDPKAGAKQGREGGAQTEADAKPVVNIADEEIRGLSLINYFMLAIGAGLFALIMPCTYPMIPITVSFFTKQAEKRGGSVLPLALIYGAGIIASFVAVGGLVVIWGVDMQAFAVNAWVNIILAGLFIFFALSLFGIIDLKPPQFLMNTAANASQSGGVLGVFLMGATLCISSFACTAPFLGTMMAAGASTGSKTLMIVGMGVFGLTMALPFVILSILPGKLPKSGSWMNTAKVIFGFVELAAALKFLSIVDVSMNAYMLPREMFLAIWAGLFAICGLYTLGFIKLKGETGEIGGGRLVTGTAIIVFAFYCGHGAMGYKLDNDVMVAFEPPYQSQTFRAVGAGGEEKKKAIGHEIVKDDFDRAVEIAKRDEKLLLVNFTGYN